MNKQEIKKENIFLLRGNLRPLEKMSLTGAGNCWRVPAAWFKAGLSWSGRDSELKEGVSKSASLYSSLIRIGPSTVSLVVSITLLSIYNYKDQ
jgi:hypothetical protein